MKVSVIIPVYNIENYVADCIRSVLRQTYSNIEIVIVDDCTKDKSMEVVAGVLDSEKTTSDVHIVRHEHNGGLSVARNTGIRHSTGDFLYFLDSDDEITPDCIEKLVTRQQEIGADIVVGGYDVRNADPGIYPELSSRLDVLVERNKILKAYMKRRVYMMAWNKLVSKELLVRNSLFFKEGLVHEDDLWSFECFCCVKTVAVVHDKTYIYKIRSGSIMDSVKLEQEVRHRLTIVEGMLACVNKHKLQKNRHVYSRLQDERLFILYQCRNNGMRDMARSCYATFPNIRTVGLAQILRWYFFNTRKLIRDAHYFLPDTLNEDFYWKAPDYAWECRKFGLKLKFYVWFIKVLLCRCSHSDIKQNFLQGR